jgi:L-alanine-DL-glutamate epimerase-like enolase superfamily enzyme
MRLLHDRFSIHPTVPFAIARSTTTAYDRVWVRLIDDDGIAGWGEAAPNKYYKESPETVVAALPKLERVVARSRTVGSLADVDVLEEWMRTDDPGNASARAAISAAAHDLLGKREGKPLWQLFGLDPMMAPPSSFTIAIADQEHVLMRRIEEAHRYPILKVKLGTDRDLETIRAVRRAAPTKILRADANAAWTVRHTLEMTRVLADAGFELLEQPLPAEDLDGFREVTRQSPIPIIADESCRMSSDLARLEGAVHGINIKLSKCGGLAEARRMALEAARRGLKVMLGCMIESSLGITAAAHLAPLANYADLDGAALLRDDPFIGASIEDGMVRLPAGPGLGVTRRT